MNHEQNSTNSGQHYIGLKLSKNVQNVDKSSIPNISSYNTRSFPKQINPKRTSSFEEKQNKKSRTRRRGKRQRNNSENKDEKGGITDDFSEITKLLSNSMKINASLFGIPESVLSKKSSISAHSTNSSDKAKNNGCLADPCGPGIACFPTTDPTSIQNFQCVCDDGTKVEPYQKCSIKSGAFCLNF